MVWPCLAGHPKKLKYPPLAESCPPSTDPERELSEQATLETNLQISFQNSSYFGPTCERFGCDPRVLILHLRLQQFIAEKLDKFDVYWRACLPAQIWDLLLNPREQVFASAFLGSTQLSRFLLAPTGVSWIISLFLENGYPQNATIIH
jgi:hypothetical protein